MSLALYMDHHLHVAITAGLRQRGVDVLTAFEDSSHALADDLLLERATRLGRVLVTKDDDLLVITHHWLRAGRDFAGLVFSRHGDLAVGAAVSDLEIIAKVMDPTEMFNRVLFIPL